MTKYVKYIRDDVAYYIDEELVPDVCPDGNFENVRSLKLLQFSAYACDIARNALVKCRYPIDEALETGLSVTPVKVSAEAVVRSVENLRNELIACSATGHLTVGEQTILFKLNSCLYKEYPHKEHK